MALKRGDVVRFNGDPMFIGLVVGNSEQGLFIHWENEPVPIGRYKTDNDAVKLSLYSKVIE